MNFEPVAKRCCPAQFAFLLLLLLKMGYINRYIYIDIYIRKIEFAEFWRILHQLCMFAEFWPILHQLSIFASSIPILTNFAPILTNFAPNYAPTLYTFSPTLHVCRIYAPILHHACMFAECFSIVCRVSTSYIYIYIYIYILKYSVNLCPPHFGQNNVILEFSFLRCSDQVQINILELQKLITSLSWLYTLI